MYNFIEFLRAIATVLIANSHFKGVYPSDLLSFGGGLGLALFYMISGFLLVNIDENTKFNKWYWKKLVRLYVPLYIVRVIDIIAGKTSIDSFGHFLKLFVFPGSWFGGSMVIFYAIYYVFVRYCYQRYKKKGWISFLGILTLVYFVLFIIRPSVASFSLETLQIHEFGIETPYLITQFIWLQCMLLGFYLRKYGLEVKEQKRRVVYLVLAFVCVLLFMIIKLLSKNGGYLSLQVLLAIAYIGFAYCLFLYFMNNEMLFTKCRETLLGRLVCLISSCSLEIYYTQFLWINLLKNIVFPLNLIALLVAIMVTAYMVHMISGFFINSIGVGKRKV